jgi:phage-related tail fiber protein
LTFGNGGFYDGRDVKVGDWVSTSNSGACLRVKSVTSQTAGTVACVLEDAHGAMNAALDPNQGGDSAIPNGVGVLFEEVGGMPVIFPLPDALPGNFTSTFAQQLVNRFFMANGGFGGQAAAITIGAITGLPSTTTVQNALEKVLPLAGGTMTGALTLSGDPTVDLHAATKKYVDNMVTGLGPKSAVRAATIGNITLSGGQTIDGISVTTGDRVLVKNQTTSSKNGIYVVDPSTWTRAADANTTAELVGAHCFVAEGTVNADTGWVCTANSTDILEASVVSWKQFSGPGMAASNGVRVATIGNITLSGGQTIDGISVATGDRVLVKNQTTPSQNGIYVVAPTTWTRAADLDSWGEFPGAFVFVEQGTVNKDTGWVCTSDQGGTVDTTAVTWTQFSGAGTVTAGSGISISGMQVSLATSGVTPSTYRSVSVDAYGRVTAGTNPTTISGYGITDALTLGLTAGAAAGTAAAGTAATAARSDHVHPAQTTITGNAATATKLQTAVNIAGVPFDGSANIAIPFTNLTGNIIANSAVKLKRPDTVNTIVDVSAGNVFTKTVTGATTFTLQNKSGDSVVDSFILEVINGGGHVITWWSDVKWAGGVAPTLTVSGKDVLGFYSHDGSSWIGTVIAKNVL